MKWTLYGQMEPTLTSRIELAGLAPARADVEDFDRVVQYYWPRILRFVLASVRDRELAETVTQDCFWNAYKNRTAFRGDSSLQTWLMRIAVNGVRRAVRSRRLQFWRQAEQSALDAAGAAEWLPDGRLSPEARLSIEQQVQAVWDATRGLSSKQQTVFLLRFMEDMSVKEIVEATGLSESAVNVHLFRAVRRVRELMENSR